MAMLVVLITLSTASSARVNEGSEERTIRSIIEQFYIQVIFVDRDVEELEKGFHSEFNMYVLGDNKIDKRTLDVWTERIRRNKNNPQAKRASYSHQIKLIDVTGPTAVVKIEIHKDSKLEYTDYLSLYKFKEGWRIMTKLFTQH